MRKTRQRALKAAFVKRHGRPPEKTRWTSRGGAYGFYTSEWRRLKKAGHP